ncbi:RING-H2 finger protein ATL22-like isoform X2 [Syzygium oleosum]|uniref:RING-H2 finger protein ATL22-like isoform X2 n=1 Tax=Syzygium oleosum TaxID=219896 RepID=UPI0024BA5336|nr:RING-H2 finger protein ATL22-like isoform X2 [Syzygium oleosum]
MASIFLVMIFLSSIFRATEACRSNSKTIQCSHGGPVIQFPFWVEFRQPRSCNSSGFELICRENATAIRFPSYGDLVVKSILYNTRKLNLIDPKSCVHEVFLNLNLSLTPFRYYYSVRNYTYLNCSAPLSNPFTEIPCLSGIGFHVYTIESSLPVPGSCKKIKTVAIPFSYNPYISDNTFGLGLTWDQPGCEGFTSNCHRHILSIDRGSGKVLSIGIIIVGLVTLVSMKIYRSRELQKLKKDQKLEAHKLLADSQSSKI